MTVVCPRCEKVHQDEGAEAGTCPICEYDHIYNVEEQDTLLKEEAQAVKESRKDMGIDGLIKGIAGIIIRVEEGALASTVTELVSTTALEHVDSFDMGAYSTAILDAKNTPTFIVREGKARNPFQGLNIAPRTEHKPNTRLETFLFETTDIRGLVEAQKRRGVAFMFDVRESKDYLYVQVRPSSYTHNTIGYIEWKGEKNIRPSVSKDGMPLIPKPDKDHIHSISWLDHSATRMTHSDRAPAILEIMGLTGYDFTKAIYVNNFNSITNVTRLAGKDFAMVLTSGIKPYTGQESIREPTEKFVHNYGKRVHHLAWQADPIEDVYRGLKEDGTEFLLDLVGDSNEGLKQTFTKPSDNTFLINEYIHRYGEFDGFFTKSNVTKLTEATNWQ